MKDKPFIHKFCDESGNKYIYCANTNRIMNVSGIIYDIIDYAGNDTSKIMEEKLTELYDRNDLMAGLFEIKNLRDRIGFAELKTPKDVLMQTTEEEYSSKIENQMKSITLNITNACNMACKYCIYGAKYHTIRSDSREFMSREVAFKAIDMLYKRSRDSENLHVGFYGDEPFLNFDLMQKTVEYIERKNEQSGAKKLFLHATTNGTLLDRKRINWVIKNNIKLLISLDGPREIHNRYRIYRNGMGTYNKIIRNLNEIRQLNNDYFKKRISFNMVIAPPFQYKKIYKYCIENDMIGVNYKISGLHYDDEGYFARISGMEGKNTHIRQILDIVNQYFKNDNGKNNEDAKKIFIKNTLNKFDLKKLSERAIKMECEENIVVPICNLGIGRCFISTDGSIYPCERIAQSNLAIIGDVYVGFYDCENGCKKGYKLMQEQYNMIRNECKHCWAFSLCGLNSCLNIALENGRLSKKALRNSCDRMRKNIEFSLKLYIMIERKYPAALEKLFGAPQ